jgi:hypothetical protein
MTILPVLARGSSVPIRKESREFDCSFFTMEVGFTKQILVASIFD